MADAAVQSMRGELWKLVARQHGVVTRGQLLDFGLSAPAISHRLSRGRLHRVWRGVYAVGRPDLTREGLWMAAVLTCGPEAALSHHSAGMLWGISPRAPGGIHVSVPLHLRPRRPGIVVHRRTFLGPFDLAQVRGIPVTTANDTLIDLAFSLEGWRLERAISEADKLGLTDPEALRRAVDEVGPRPGVRTLRTLLDRPGFRVTDSELERRFLLLAHDAGLPAPRTRQFVNGFRVDFHWPELGLVVETDGLLYHRTPGQQARDRLRDQTHTAAGLTCLRFTHAQVTGGPAHVRATLHAVARRT